jgi:serine protease inhibitor
MKYRSILNKTGKIKHKSFYSIVILLLFVIIFSQCRDSQVDTGINEDQAKTRELSVLEKKVVQSDNKLGFKIFNEINKSEKDNNLFISPASISFALAMAYNGANGSTREAMQSVLEMQGLSQQEINENFNSLMNLLQNIDPKVIIQIANSVWYRQGKTFEESFFNDCKKYFNAEITGMNFSNPEAADIINGWVDKNTNGMIKQIVDKPIDPDVVMYIINAIYFKASWTYRFEENKTRDDNFTLSNGKTKPCKMMSQSARYLYYDDNDFQAIDLPYGKNGYSMTIFLPKPGIDINNFVSRLNQENYENWLTKFKKDSVELFMPKFKLEYEILLNDVLTSLGMGVAFSGNADFTNMYKLGGIYISKVKHKTFIDVNEEGTEAAGVTSIEFREVSLPVVPRVYINRPFVFMIRENKSQTILFMGKISEPKY